MPDQFIPKRPIVIPIGPSIAYVPLTQGQFACIDVDDVALVGDRNWYAHWSEQTQSYYAQTAGNVAMHRVIAS